jgi:DNA-binding winged helix-turn-helix (wHTH) protein/Tfp pilus assembly protein PilF
MHAAEDRVFEFENFILAPKERLLLCGGEPVPLTAKAFDLLVALVRRSGHLISKDDLLRAVWPNTVVEEVNLTVNISALRKALGRGRNGKELIQTVPTRGYRFVASVRTRDAAVALELQHPSRGLRMQLPNQERRQLGQRVTENADAYRAYLQGRHDWNQRSEESLKRGIASFQRAVYIDPLFAAAYSGLADCYAALGYLSYIAPAEAFPAARRYATKALELDATLAEPHASLGLVKLYFDWDWLGADADFQRATALDPDYAPTHEWYSIYLLAAGRTAEAFREIQLARQRDPLSLSINSDLGFHHYYTGQYDEAVKQLKFVLEMNLNFPPAHLWLGRTFQELGKFDEAVAEFRQVEEVLRNWPVSIAARGFVAAAAGRTEEAWEILAELERLARRKFVTSYGIALVYAGLGQNDAAFTRLGKAFDERSHWLVWLRLDPRWNALRADPRFAQLVDRMRFPQSTQGIQRPPDPG